MSRVSLEEMYDDKDVVTQICRLKDGLNGALGGIISEVSVDQNNELVFEFADGTSMTVPLPDPTTGITSVTGNVSGGNLTITFNFVGGTTHSFTCPLSGMASEAYVNAGLALKADAATTYTRADVDGLLAGKADAATTYTKNETDALIAPDVQYLNLATIPGITLITSDNNDAGRMAIRMGNMVLLNLSLQLNGTYTGTTGWVDLFDIPIYPGKTAIRPFFVTDLASSTPVVTATRIIQGNAMFMDNGQSYSMWIEKQIVLMLTDA